MPTGIDPRSVLKMEVTICLTTPRHADAAKRAFSTRCSSGCARCQACKAAGIVDTLPVTGGGSVQPMVVGGARGASAQRAADGEVRADSPARATRGTMGDSR